MDSRLDIRERWRLRIRRAQEAQKPFWGTWATNLAFAAGQHWLVWDQKARMLRSLQEVDRRYQGRELYTADRITELRQAQLGELASDGERPELLPTQAGEEAEDATRILNALCAYAWQNEWDAEAVLHRARRLCLDLGVSAIRCRWDPDEGPVIGHLPVAADGSPADESLLEETGQLPDGSLPRFKPVRQGRTRWEVYSAFQILPPPGIVHEDDFTWECLVKPVPVEDVADMYGVQVAEDTDIVSTIGMPASLVEQSGQRANNKLQGHCWLYLCFERPSRRHPQGATLVFAGSGLELVHASEGLPYTLDGKPHSGIIYLHWWRLADRFWSRAFTESLKDPQRIINRRKTQNVEIFDRGMPKLIVRKGEWPGSPIGAPLEVVELERTASAPQIHSSITPSAVVYQDIQSLDEDLYRASTLNPLRLGMNPANVETYAQLALLDSNEHEKRSSVQVEHRLAVARLVMLSLGDIRRYWPHERELQVVGENDRIEHIIFRKSMLPDDVRVKVASGAPLPRSQGAEVKKIEAIWTSLVQSGLAAADPVSAVAWYKNSLEAGKALELPHEQPSTQEQLARMENLIMRTGGEPQPAYWDNAEKHIPLHRREQDEARSHNDVELVERIERHIQAHRAIVALSSLPETTGAGQPPGEQPQGEQPAQGPQQAVLTMGQRPQEG